MTTHSPSPVPISRAKLERPFVAGHWVPRPRLEARLDLGLTRSVIVVAAPAGHGKTSTIVRWLEHRGIGAAWLSVDRRDALLTRMAAHLAVALDRLLPGVAARLFALLTMPDRLPSDELGEAFGDALYDLDRDAVLVVDDFHAAEGRATGRFVEALLQAAPRRLHTILISRAAPRFPLARMRATGDVVELTGADLRFTPEETGEMLRLETGARIEPALAASIHASVGGWPAAIRLVAISQPDNDWAPTHSVINERQTQLLGDYLGEDVLVGLPAADRDLLVRASLLERFNGPLLGVLAIEASRSPITPANLEHLRELELFREIPGLADTWFAFHPVFRDVLRRTLARTTDSQTIAELRRRAARWLATAGLTGEALQHLVAAGDIAAAAALVESRLTDAFSREEWQAIAGWLRWIPANEIQGRPELLLASAWVAYLSGRQSHVTGAQAALRDPSLRDHATEAQRAEIALIADGADADPRDWLAKIESAIPRLSPCKRYRLGYAHMMRGLALTSLGRADEALAELTAFTERESARIDAASIRGYFGRALVLWQTGQLTRCEQVAADQLQLAQTNALPISAGWARVLLGAVAYERGDLAHAASAFEAVIADAEQVHFECLREAFFGLILGYEARGLRSEADRAIARLREFCRETESLHQLDLVDSLVARLALLRGDLATARRWLDSSRPTLLHDDLKTIEHPLLTRIKALIAVGGRDGLREAERHLADFVQLARATHMKLALLEGLAVQALLSEETGEQKGVERLLTESLMLAAPEGIVQPYAHLGPALAPILRRLLDGDVANQHARHALGALEFVVAAAPASSPPAARQRLPNHPANPLTARELEVLRLLALRLTNQEIGDDLFISPLTVKRHLEHISEKLGVSGRRAIVDHAIDLGLVHADR